MDASSVETDREIRHTGVASRSAMVLGVVALALVLATGGILLYRFDPRTIAILPPCLFHRLTGLYCPGCGSTRAMHALMRGGIVGALRMNPLAVAIAPLLAYIVTLTLIAWMRRREPPRFAARPRWITALAVVVVVFWIARNVPIYPFTLLAP